MAQFGIIVAAVVTANLLTLLAVWAAGTVAGRFTRAPEVEPEPEGPPARRKEPKLDGVADDNPMESEDQRIKEAQERRGFFR